MPDEAVVLPVEDELLLAESLDAAPLDDELDEPEEPDEPEELDEPEEPDEPEFEEAEADEDVVEAVESPALSVAVCDAVSQAATKKAMATSAIRRCNMVMLPVFIRRDHPM